MTRMITKVCVAATIALLKVEATTIVATNRKIGDYFPLTVNQTVSVCEITTSMCSWVKITVATLKSSKEIVILLLVMLLIIVRQVMIIIVIVIEETRQVIVQMAICLRSPPSLPQAAPSPPSSLFRLRWPALPFLLYTNINTVNLTAVIIRNKLTITTKEITFTKEIKVALALKPINTTNRKSATHYVNGTNTKRTSNTSKV